MLKRLVTCFKPFEFFKLLEPFQRLKKQKAHDRFRDHGLLNDSFIFYFRLTLDPPQASSKARNREPHGGTSWTETTPAP
jgi:hypothetical protein